MKNWVIKNKGNEAIRKQIAETYNLTDGMAHILMNRGITDLNEYLTCTKLHNPWQLKDMEKAVSIINDKIANNKKIRICGDMDVDGIASTTDSYIGLKLCGADVDYDIPHKVLDGYGLNKRMVDDAVDDGIDTLITVDNGIAAFEAIEYAKSLGLTVIVTDHHQIPFTEDGEEKFYILPQADAIINPHQEDCTYPYPHICGAMVAFKLMQALFQTRGISEDYLIPMKELTALATICDVMNLEDENRTIVKQGLEVLRQSSFAGIHALADVAGIDVGKISVYHCGFIIGPCLNASGRLDTAKKGIALLLENNIEEAMRKASELHMLNEERKELTRIAFEAACEHLDSLPALDRILVLHIPICNESVAGIVAGRIREKYQHPTIILANGQEEGVLKGSGRSIEAYDMFTEVGKHKDVLLKFGGHAMAAGLSLKADKLEEFREKVNESCELEEKDFVTKIAIDLNLPLHLITPRLIQELDLVEPCGKGNPKPIIAERNISAKRGVIIGKNKNVLKLSLAMQSGRIITAMYFGDIEEMKSYYCTKYSEKDWDNMMNGFDNHIKMTITYEPSINTWNGREEIQITIRDYK